ncbi:MAG TPA: sugar kinase, partial [Feifaniaceae bacterium]|nr:sugar kinase [Feifaniaceae bacterium]
MVKKAVTFGELMARLNPPANERFVQAEEFEVSYAGGEANVAVSLANYGVDAAFVTKLPQHEIGQAALNLLRQYGVDTRHILRGGPRLGVYYVEKGASQRPSKIIYDRAGSSVALSKPGEYDWDAVFQDVNWFHFTGITPALGGALPDICEEACKSAKAHGATVSCDLNYRGKLWSREQANAVMTRLMRYVDVCIANEEDAADVFGIRAASTDVKTGKLNRDGYTDVARQLTERFQCAAVAVTLRGSISASVNEGAGMLYQGGTPYFSPNFT